MNIDVEPDARLISGSEAEWQGFLLMFDYIGAIRPKLEDRFGAPVNFNWLIRLDPQIAEGFGDPGWALKMHGDKLDALKDAGDEVGLHVHTWRSTRRFFRRIWVELPPEIRTLT